MQERRKYVRRKADRELLQKVQQFEAWTDRRGASDSDSAKRSRRRAIRHNCTVAIQVHIRHSAGSSDTWSDDFLKVKGRVLDLSTDGASLLTKQAVDTGQELQLGIKLRDGSEINSTGEVRWVKLLRDKGAYASGVRFTGVSNKDQKKIQRFLEELDASAGL